jgi:hypothetical protein
MPGGDAGMGGSFATLYTTVLTPAMCAAHHAGATASGGLDMSTEMKAYTNLTTGMSSATVEKGCNESYVVKGNAMMSLLYQKVAGTQPAACGAQMPKGLTPLSAANIALVEAWINGGANP